MAVSHVDLVSQSILTKNNFERNTAFVQYVKNNSIRSLYFVRGKVGFVITTSIYLISKPIIFDIYL